MRWSGRRSVATHYSLAAQELHRLGGVVGEHRCCERATEHRRGIDIEAVGPLIRQTVPERRVAVDDEPPIVALMGEKRLADPELILLALPAERTLGIDAGVHEIAAAIVEAERERG